MKRCLKVNHHPKTSDESKKRFQNIIPISIEKINRKYRQASLSGCNLGTIPDQSTVSHTFNSSVEMGEIDGSWNIKKGSEIPGWKVRFINQDQTIAGKEGYLEIQKNSLFRKGEAGESEKYYTELDSHCPKGKTCPSTNISVLQKVIVSDTAKFQLKFEARKRVMRADDSIIEIYLYKKAQKEKIELS